MKPSVLSKIAPVLLALILATTFVQLGIWQLHRAQDSKALAKPVKDLPMIALPSIAAPSENLSGSAINRIVSTTGNYVETYSAPHQEVMNSSNEKKLSETLEVRLLRIKPNSGILVVRGIESSSTQEISEAVKIIGRLYPRQSDNHADPSAGILTRLDPSLIAGAQGLKLFDGYIVAMDEQTEYGQAISALRIPAPAAKSTTPGFYWQHVSYVFIWWLMALLVLVIPFYGRLKDRISA